MQMGDRNRQFRHSLVRIVSIGGFAAFVAASSWTVAERIEGRLESQARTALDEAGITASVHFDGRDAVLEGVVASPDESRRARILVTDLRGTRHVDSRLRISTALDQAAPVTEPTTELPARPETTIPAPPAGHLLFDSEKSSPHPQSQHYLDAFANYLRRYPERRAVIEGHTDAIGPRPINQELSERRAQAVAEALVARGVAPGRLTVRGFADTRPVASNRTPDGRAANRRVEIIVEGIA